MSGRTRFAFTSTAVLLATGVILSRPLRISSIGPESFENATTSPRANSASFIPHFEVVPAPLIHFPGGHNSNRNADFFADSNSPSFWDGENLYVVNSWEQPWVSAGPDFAHLGPALPSGFDDPQMKRLWIWIETAYRDSEGTIYAWYHNEVPNVCPPRNDDLPGYPVVAKIGGLRSSDDGHHWTNLGYVLEPQKGSIDCGTQDKWYAGGVGDFSVTLDQDRQFFYFYFTNYPADFAQQGIAIARMKYADRNVPGGKLQLWNHGEWSGNTVSGPVSPIFPAEIDVRRKDGRTYWGPSIHWNTYLHEYVMFLNKIKDTSWATQKLCISFNPNIANPSGWSVPALLMDGDEARRVNPGKPGNGWYIQAMGTEKGESDKISGQVARLFVDGQSRWKIRFSK